MTRSGAKRPPIDGLGLSGAAALALFAMSFAVMLASALNHYGAMPFRLVSGDYFFDLMIYRQAAGVILHGAPLYSHHFAIGLGFTYPPFAGLLFIALRAEPFSTDAVLTVIAAALYVLIIVRCSLRIAARNDHRADPFPVWLTLTLAALVLWFEPVLSTIGFGQINLLITALVIADLAYCEGTRLGGIGIGIAAALKLTPLIFILYLVVTGRVRSAGRAICAFVLAIAISFVVLPGDAATYWGGGFLDTGRVTGSHSFASRGPADQSLRGALLRIAPSAGHQTLLWVGASAVVLLVGMWLAVRAARRGNEALGFSLVAVTGLLISPVSWTHHWTIAVPGVVMLLVRTPRSFGGRLGRVAVAALALASWTIWLVIDRHPDGRELGIGGMLLGNAYVIAGLGLLAACAVGELRSRIAPTPATLVASAGR